MSAPKRGPSKRARGGSAPPARRPRGARKLNWKVGVAALVAGLVAHRCVDTVAWLGTPHDGAGQYVTVDWPADAAVGAERLAALGALDGPLRFRLLLLVSAPLLSPATGEHFLRDDLTPTELLRRLARLSSRERVQVLIPEGTQRFQVGERLSALGVCSAAAFERAATDRGLLEPLGIRADSAEGYLFPAKYDLFTDSEARVVLTTLVKEAQKRLAALRATHAARFDELADRFDWGEHEILTLASVVERESARAEELPLVASVFLNRLSDPTFKPARMLQSDPTAAYGCLLSKALPSCAGFSGKVVPAMLRDPGNAYNTYRHAGLPPGPISNPGAKAIEAVLSPAKTDYLFFVATGGGKHTFSRTFEEHEAAIPR